MIEDYQSEYSPKNSNAKKRERHGRFVLFFLFLIAWLILAVITYSVFNRTISENLANTNAIEVIKNRKELKNEINNEEHTLCFAVLTSGAPEFRNYKTQVLSTGSTSYHTAIEGLLDGPDIAAVSEGAVSLINSNTKLEGFAISGKTCFINLSDDFLNSEDLDSAKTQIKRTLQAENSNLSEFVFLVNNKEV